MRKRLIVIGVLALTGLAGCGQDTPIGGIETPGPQAAVSASHGPVPGEGVRAATATPGATPTLPACTPPLDNITSLPQGFPDFPFPPGLQVTNTWELDGDPNSLQILGYVPLGLNEAARYVIAELPRRGYALGYGDSEANEIESQFSGKGWRGAFVLRSIYECEGVSLWRVVMLKK